MLRLLVCSLLAITTRAVIVYSYSCTNTSCTNCWSSNTCLYTCQTGYRFVNWMCTNCPTSCLFCDTTLTLCNYCEGGYGLDLPNRVCVACTDIGCASCPYDKTSCEYCGAIGLGVMNADCVACNDVNCKYCGASYLVCY